MTTNPAIDFNILDEMSPFASRAWFSLADIIGEDLVINRFGSVALGRCSQAGRIWEDFPQFVAIIDTSSVFPKSYIRTETFHIQKTITKSKTVSYAQDDHDFRLPPKRTYEVNIKVQSWEKATPKIIL